MRRAGKPKRNMVPESPQNSSTADPAQPRLGQDRHCQSLRVKPRKNRLLCSLKTHSRLVFITCNDRMRCSLGNHGFETVLLPGVKGRTGTSESQTALGSYAGYLKKSQVTDATAKTENTAAQGGGKQD